MKSFKEVSNESNDDNLKVVFRELETFLRKVRGVDVRKEDIKDWHNPKLLLVVAARYWGKWNLPDGQEDEEDYDWEELDSSSASMLKTFLKQVETKHPKYKLHFGTEEKNWIYIFVEKK